MLIWPARRQTYNERLPRRGRPERCQLIHILLLSIVKRLGDLCGFDPPRPRWLTEMQATNERTVWHEFASEAEREDLQDCSKTCDDLHVWLLASKEDG